MNRENQITLSMPLDAKIYWNRFITTRHCHPVDRNRRCVLGDEDSPVMVYMRGEARWCEGARNVVVVQKVGKGKVGLQLHNL